MRVLAVYNCEGSKLGQVGQALEEAGAEVELLHPHLGDEVPEAPEGYDGLVVLGGTQNALADDACPWLPKLCGLMRAFGETDRSVLGICLGSQLLARAYGGDNIIGGASEFGWQKVQLTTQGKDDPIFSDLPSAFHMFQWHDDTFNLPPGVDRLAASSQVKNQAFRMGRAAYGLQFHFEADRALVDVWNREFASWLEENRPGWLERHPAEAAKLGPKADAAGLTIARNWVRTIIPSRG